MPKNYLGIHGVENFIVAVGDNGEIIHFAGDTYQARKVDSPTKAHLHAVWVVSERCAWAVGEQGAVLRWDGTVWTTIAMEAKDDELNAVWVCPEADGRHSVWIGGLDTLIVYDPAAGAQGTLMHTSENVIGIWGSGPDDIWFLCAGRLVLHWDGVCCTVENLPGDDEYCAIGGSGPDDPVWVVGCNGAVVSSDGNGWEIIDSETDAMLIGVYATSPQDVWTTTHTGQLRYWDGIGWTMAAHSVFGWLGKVCVIDGTVWTAGARGVVLQHRPQEAQDDE